MTDLPLTMTCGPYDRAQALIDGSVRPRGVQLEIHLESVDHVRQAAIRRGDFQVGEFYIAEYLMDLPSRSLAVTAIPIFVKRIFRHSSIYVNSKAGIRSPEDLHGKRVGVQRWTQTNVLWVRGILEDEYGVDYRKIEWVAQRPAASATWRPPPDVRLKMLDPDATLHDLLATGELDAVITTEAWAPGGHPDIAFLFPNHGEVERDYYRRTGYFPIHHLLVIQTALLSEHPWIARSLYDAWQESKNRCYEWLQWQRLHQTSLWYRSLWEEERESGGADFYRWGFKDNRRELKTILEYAKRQQLLDGEYEPEDLFHESVLDT